MNKKFVIIEKQIVLQICVFSMIPKLYSDLFYLVRFKSYGHFDFGNDFETFSKIDRDRYLNREWQTFQKVIKILFFMFSVKYGDHSLNQINDDHIVSNDMNRLTNKLQDPIFSQGLRELFRTPPETKVGRKLNGEKPLL